MCANISEIFVDFAKNTSIHGFKYIVASTTTLLERIFWILILILSLSFSCYLATLFWTRYTSNPTRTTLKTTFAPITTVQFPGVTICNRDRVLESRLNTFLTKLDGNEQDLYTLKNLFLYVNNAELMTKNDSFYNVTALDIAQNVLNQNDYFEMRTILRKVSQKCEEMIIRCAWNRKLVSCKDIFEESFTINGKCCSFNYIQEKSLKAPLYTFYYGLSTGLKVLLKPASNDKDLTGVTVIIHGPEDVPSAGQNIRKYFSVGRVNYIQVEGSKGECTKEVKALPVSHRQCLNPDEKDLKYFSKYTDSNCIPLCEAMLIYQHCGCIPYYYDFIDDKPLCDIQRLNCLKNITTDTTVSAESCGCLSQCDDEFYDVTVTSGKFVYNPSVWMIDFLDDINDTENSILLNIFFSTNHQTIWIRNTMTSGIYLISSFGGIYSLFLGCSIITVVEILYYCIVKCFLKKIYRKENENKGKKHARQLQGGYFKDRIYTVSKEVIEQGEYDPKPVMPFVE